MGVRYRVGMQTRRYQTGKMGHINPQVGTNFIGNLTEFREIQLTGVCRPSGNNNLGTLRKCELPNLFHIDPTVFAYLVGNNLVELTRDVQLHTVRKVPTVSQRKTHDLLTGGQQGVHDGVIRLGTGVRLYVGVFGTEEFLDPFNSQLFDDIDEFTTTIVAAARVTFRILIGQH